MNTVLFDPHAIKDLKKLPKPIQKLIFEKITWVSSQQNPLAFAKKLTNFDIGSYRFRIGNYRAIVDLQDSTIIVLRIGHRKNIYR